MGKNNKKGNYLVGGIIAIILGILIIGGMPTDKNYVSDNNSEFNYSENISENVVSDNKESKVDSQLKISYIDVGQADSILIQNEGKNMLIDAGNNADGELLVKYLKGLRYK